MKTAFATTVLVAAAASAVMGGIAVAQSRTYQGQQPYQGQPNQGQFNQGQFNQGQTFPGQSSQTQGAAPRGPSLTLFQLPNFQGASRTFTTDVDNLADLGLNDLAQSARVNGRWRVCEDAKMRGRCTDVAGDVANLADIRMTVAISSFQSLDRTNNGRDNRGGFNGGGGFGGGVGQQNFGGQSLDGRSVSFFPRPAPGPYRDASDFCRRLGFSGVIYADDRGRELADVVCRR